MSSITNKLTYLLTRLCVVINSDSFLVKTKWCHWRWVVIVLMNIVLDCARSPGDCKDRPVCSSPMLRSRKFSGACSIFFLPQPGQTGGIWLFGLVFCWVQYDMIRYDSVYLTCSKKLTGSQLRPPHRTNKKLKCETKNKTMSMIGLVCHIVMKAVR